MGENPKNVYLTGCPSIDLIKNLKLSIDRNFIKKYSSLGVGSKIDFQKEYIVILQHPVTTEYKKSLYQINQTIKAVKDLDLQIVWLWPNVDAGSDAISNGLRTFRESKKTGISRFYKNFEPEDYLKLINNSLCLVGNSSSGIREGSFLGIPTVNIGNRQSNREYGKNVISVSHEANKINKAIKKMIKLKDLNLRKFT